MVRKRESLGISLGPSPPTGEVYFSVAVITGKKVDCIKDPLTKRTIVFMAESIAWEIKRQFEASQKAEKDFFPGSIFGIVRMEVARPGEIIRPNLGSLKL